MPDRLSVPAREAARMLGIPRTRFRRYVVEGLLPRPVLIGRDEVWRVADLEAAISGGTVEQELEW